MVLIHFKKTENNQFLYETPASTSIDVLISELIHINNTRVVIDRLSQFVEDLATYGPIKPEELRGLTSEETLKSAAETLPPEKAKYAQKQPLHPGQRYNEDKTGFRIGVILNEEVTNMMIAEAQKAKKYIHKQQVDLKQCVTGKGLQDCLDGLRGAVMIAYPGYFGLPEYEPAREVLENKVDFQYVQTDYFDYFIEKDTSLWWAGKELLRGKLLSDFIGKNEKTKIVVRLQKSGAGAPVREPAVDEETYKKMLSYYYKKQEEAKQLEDDSEDHYMNSAWANPKNLKNQLHGQNSEIKWKPFK